ncbi:cupin [Marinomonas agarivorans]|nr:cupin [Marinomonas agarivorans]
MKTTDKIAETTDKIAADFTKTVVMHSKELPWQASPMAGVDRRPLDRVGGEVARATTIVRYAPGSKFSAHTHTGGEEFVVLEGTFQDEHGDYPQGSYVRNPPTSQHTPGSEQGCIIFVKLWQFQPHDRAYVRIPTEKIGAVEVNEASGVRVTPLFEDGVEQVMIVTLQANTQWCLSAPQGAELLVLSGNITVTSCQLAQQDKRTDVLRTHSWLRAPIKSDLDLRSGTGEVSVWLKLGHLPMVDEQIKRVMQQK